MKIEIQEFKSGRLIRTATIENRAEFIQIVDKIRRKRDSGWHLLLNGIISDEIAAFGSSVCYGINEPSCFNDSKCPLCLEPMGDTSGDIDPTKEIYNVHIGRAHLACVLLLAIDVPYTRNAL